jgi:hypothetical protein
MTTSNDAARKLAEDARAWIVDLAAGRRKWRMCIPVQPDDTDVVLIGLYEAFLAALDRIEQLERVVEAARAFVAASKTDLTRVGSPGYGVAVRAQDAALEKLERVVGDNNANQ